jgi:Ca-activated chloride channel family protein
MTSRPIIGLVIAAGLVRPLAFHGQGPIEPRQNARATPTQNPKDNSEPRVNLRVDTTLVLVPVEVSDELNRPISGLEKENFHVFDDKVEQKITAFAMEDEPIAICLVFDVSGSMSGTLPNTVGAAENFFRTANLGDQFCLVTLASEAKLVVPLTEHPGDIQSRLLFVKTGGSTALMDGIYLAMNEVKKAKTMRKALVIISDGGENNSRYTETEIKNAVRESDALIYSMGIWGTGKDAIYDSRDVIEALAKASGGGLFAAGTPKEFAEKIVTDLRNRYLLGYSPTDPAKDGRFHRVEVKLAPPRGLPKLRAHWKTGYYAPTQ